MKPTLCSSRRKEALFISVALALIWCCHAAFAATFSVSMRNFVFSPASLTINVGDTVTWTDQQGNHDTVAGVGGVPSGVWNSNNQYHRLMNVTETFSFTFNTPGTFPYYC